MKAIFLSVLFSIACLLSFAQASFDEIKADRSKAGSLYYLYPVTKSLNTTPPKGYKPFYISHYGRHGSRYLVNAEDYTVPLKIFQNADKAGKLTDYGKDVLNRLIIVQKDADGREGELTEIGVEQHRGIAQRMYASFPDVFKNSPAISAKSTTRMRCAHSMMAFCEALKEIDPKLIIPKESAKRYMNYLSNWTPQAAEFNRWDGPATQSANTFGNEMSNSDRLMSMLFNDSQYASTAFDAKDLMRRLFLIDIDLPNTKCDISLDDLFTDEELYDQWQAINFKYYITMSNPTSANGVVLNNALPLLENILTSAQIMIESGKHGADLRFGHDSCIVPLLGLIKAENCHGSTDDPHSLKDVYADFKISPMAANLQLVFFKNKANDIIVKFLLNECEISIPVATDIAPFYHWTDVKSYFEDILKQ